MRPNISSRVGPPFVLVLLSVVLSVVLSVSPLHKSVLQEHTVLTLLNASAGRVLSQQSNLGLQSRESKDFNFVQPLNAVPI